MPELEAGNVIPETGNATEQAVKEQQEAAAKEAIEKAGEGKTAEELAAEAAKAEEAKKYEGKTPEEIEALKADEEAKKYEGKTPEEIEALKADEAAAAQRVDMQTRVRDALQKAKTESLSRSQSDARVASLEQEVAALKAKTEAEVKPYVDLTLEDVEASVVRLEASVAELELSGRKFEARLAQRKLDKYLDFVEQNEAKRVEYVAKQAKEVEAKTTSAKQLESMQKDAEFYRDARKIPAEVWDAAGVWLKDHFEANPIDGRKFAELMDRRGPMAAYDWAEQLVSDHFVAQVEKQRKTVEKGKAANLGGSGAAILSTKPLTGDEPVGDYIKRREKEEAAKRGK